MFDVTQFPTPVFHQNPCRTLLTQRHDRRGPCYVDFRVRWFSMDRAGDCSVDAAPFGGSTPSVTSARRRWRRGERDEIGSLRRAGESWLKCTTKQVGAGILEAPHPRPRPHRRRNRRRGQQIIRAALSNDQQSAAPANEAIWVLQASLRTVILRAETTEREL